MPTAQRQKELNELLSSLNMVIDDYDLLDKSLTHGSYTFENKLSSLENNERMEFLGDAVLKLIASRYLYDRFPEYAEGELTKIRSILISDSTLAKIAQKINLGKYLKLGFHENKMGGRKRSSTLACAFEAMLGAFYLDDKIDQLDIFLQNILEPEVTEIDKSASKYNYKAILQEYAQANSLELPDYKIVEEKGPAHDRTFGIEVLVNDELLGYGTGKSKKEAQQQAAKMALSALSLLEDEGEQEE
ncbi:MAG: ribonuclease III [Candidatus Melainabacteria bacterium GWF2_37_15]|nr:MAG: ribonuclease III [Candidatus Melainabacteria bacterium GWF2_37_15]